LMACADQGIGEQEQQYYQALESVGGFEVSGDRLTIFYDGGQGALNFVRADAASP